jgi:putative peptidoglycan binding protein
MSQVRRRAVVPLCVVIALLSLPVAALKSTTLTKDEIRQAEQWLAGLGFWTGPTDGVWDGASRHALIAFQKIQKARPTGTLTRAEWNALSQASPPRPLHSPGPHLEVDLARQVLFLVDPEGRVGNILPISSGSGKTFHEKGYPETHAITPCGRLEVYAKASGWKTSPLGEMHNPMYIVGGIAIHMFASYRLPQMVPKGTPVFVYGCKEEKPVLPVVQEEVAVGH